MKGKNVPLKPILMMEGRMEKRNFKDFITFKSMVTPYLIQIIFWLGIVIVFATGIFLMTSGGIEILAGLFMWFFGVFYVRVFCEIMIIFFRIYDTLREIKDSLAPGGEGATPPGAGSAQQVLPPAEEDLEVEPRGEERLRSCPKCGNLVQEGMNFCNKCGSTLG